MALVLRLVKGSPLTNLEVDNNFTYLDQRISTVDQNKQNANANLSMLAGLTPAASRLPYFSSANQMSLAPFNDFGRSFVSATLKSEALVALTLNNVDNTSDANKPISTAQANGLQAKITAANRAEVQTALALVPTQGFIDNTAGRMLKVGDYGLGGAIPVQDANLANTINGGLYKLVTPFTNGPTSAAYIIQTLVYDAEVTQIAYVEGATFSVKYMRQYRAGWQPWIKLATAPMAGEVPPLYTGNIDDVNSIPYGYVTVTSTSTGTKPTGKSFGFVQTFGQAPGASSAIRQIWNDFDGLVGTKTTWVRDKYGTAAFGNWRLMYDQNTVVGVVANPSNPNGGSIIEFNSNANGAYVRFIDGTQIAWRRIGSTTATGYPLGTTGLLGGDAFGGAVPINFSAIPAVTCSMTTTSGNPAALIASQFAGPTVSSFGNWRAVVLDQSVLNNGIIINLIAVGRWY